MDLRWISLLLFALLVLRKSGQLFYDDLGGFRTFAMIDIASHFEILTIPGVSAAPVGSAEYAVLHAIFSDTRAGGLPWLRLLERRLDIGAALARVLRAGLVSVLAWEFSFRAQRRLDTSFGTLSSWGPCPSVAEMVADFQVLRQTVLSRQNVRPRFRTPSPRRSAVQSCSPLTPRTAAAFLDQGPRSPMHIRDSPYSQRAKSFTASIGML